MSLRDLLVDAVGQLDDVETTLTPDGAITWSPAQRPCPSSIGSIPEDRVLGGDLAILAPYVDTSLW